MNIKELINNNEFIEEPVENISKNIFKTSSNNIIVEGGRGCGKTIVLNYIENNKINSKSPTIYTCFDSMSSFSTVPNEIYSKEFFEHYYELLMSFKIIQFIDNNYNDYFSNFFEERKLIYNLLLETQNFVRERLFRDIKINKYLKKYEISKVLIEKLKLCLNIEDINIIIDRFDWTNNRSEYTQHLLKEYFNLFNKTIITTDDKIDITRRRELINNGYVFEKIRYGSNISILKEIIINRIKVYNQTNNTNLSESLVSDEILKRLINDFNNDLSSMITVVFNSLESYNFYKKRSISKIIDGQIEDRRNYKKRVISPKLYL